MRSFMSSRAFIFNLSNVNLKIGMTLMITFRGLSHFRCLRAQFIDNTKIKSNRVEKRTKWKQRRTQLDSIQNQHIWRITSSTSTLNRKREMRNERRTWEINWEIFGNIFRFSAQLSIEQASKNTKLTSKSEESKKWETKSAFHMTTRAWWWWHVIKML